MWAFDMLKSKTFWIVVSLALLIGLGWYVKGVFDERARLAKEVSELKAMAKLSRDLQSTATQDESDYIKGLLASKEKADERSRNLEKALVSSNHSLRSCTIDAAVLSVLNDDGSGPAGATPGAGPGSAEVEAGPAATCEDLVKNYEENRGAFDAAVRQVEGLRKFYKDVRSTYCARTGAC